MPEVKPQSDIQKPPGGPPKTVAVRKMLLGFNGFEFARFSL
jgi:hypothetical protein